MEKRARKSPLRAPKGGDTRRSAIALLSDFGVSGFYVGAMKAAILAVDPRAVFFDLSHGIRPFAVAEGSFVLSAVFEYCAPGTVFLAVVDPGVGGARRNLVVRSRDRFVVCPDNGIASDVAQRFGVECVHEIDESAVASIRKHRARGRTFLGRDVFAPVAAFLAAGGDAESLGTRAEGIHRLDLPAVEVRDGYVRGQSRYADDYGNLITNVSGDHISQGFADIPLAGMEARVDGVPLAGGVDEYFSEGAPGELMLIIDSWDLLEIAVREGRAADRFRQRWPVVVELRRR